MWVSCEIVAVVFMRMDCVSGEVREKSVKFSDLDSACRYALDADECSDVIGCVDVVSQLTGEVYFSVQDGVIEWDVRG